MAMLQHVTGALFGGRLFLRVCCFALVLGGFAFSASSAWAAAQESQPIKGTVEWRVSADAGSELQLQVRNESMQQVLHVITAKTGVPINYSVIPNGLVNATCVGSTLKQIMDCLLAGKADSIVRYNKTADKKAAAQVAEIWVLGSLIADGTDCSALTVASPSVQKAITASDAGAEESADSLLEMAKSSDTATRAGAIGALMGVGKEKDAEIKTVLENALHDADPTVRAQAISSLAYREGPAAGAVLQAGIDDEDADVRLMAVSGIIDDVALLQRASNDSDEAVRSLAKSKLRQLQNRTP